MPKAYWIAHVDVHDEANYPDYITTAAPAFQRYGAKFLVRGAPIATSEGNTRARNVVIEFANLADAKACYECAEYQAALKIRQACSDSDLIVIEGYEG